MRSEREREILTVQTTEKTSGGMVLSSSPIKTTVPYTRMQPITATLFSLGLDSLMYLPPNNTQ